MDKNSTPKKKLANARKERLKNSLKANVAKRKAQAKGRAVNSLNNKDTEFKLED